MKQKNNREKMFSAKSQALNIGIVVLILALTLFVLFNSLYDPDHPIKFSYFLHIHWGWLLIGILLLGVSVLCEARSLSLILKNIGHRRSLRDSVVYASSDIYFSAITPSASGGQPAAAYYMTKSGVPLSQSSAVLVLNVTIYTVALLIMGAIALIARPGFYAAFPTTAKLCFWLGIGFHALLIFACVLFMFSKKVVMLVGRAVIYMLAALHIFKNREEKLEAFAASIETYRSCVSIIKRNPFLIVRLIFYSVSQRLILIPITYLVFLAMGLDASFGDVFIMQIYCTVGASAIPLPGAVGISETLYLIVFERFVSDPNLCMFSMVLSRSVSGYLAIMICGCITMTYHMRHVIRPRRAAALSNDATEEDEDATECE